MKRYLITSVGMVLAGALLITISGDQSLQAHCQVPCGIYDDHARIQAMLEDTTTIAKAMRLINELAVKRDPLSLNQTARWINTKEQHASHIISTVSEYFLTQKVKEVAPGEDDYQKYLQSLATHHRVLRAAMKTKQTVEAANADKLEQAIRALAKLYD